MLETPASTDDLPRDPLEQLSPGLKRRAPSLISNGSTEHKAVRFGSLESAPVTLAKQSVLPAVVVITLAICMRVVGHAPLAHVSALALVAFLISAQILSPLDLRRVKSHGRGLKLRVRLLLEWSCVVATLVFLALSFNLTHVFARELILSWFIATPVALLLADSMSYPLARWFAADQAIVKRYIIIGANEVGLELARRVEESESFGKFFGFFDYRNAERLGELCAQRVNGNCKAADFAEFVRNNSIDRVYIALPISTAPRIEELLGELRDTTASIYFVPNLFAFDLVQARCVAIGGMPAFSICDSPLQGMHAFWKRTLDLAVAGVVLLLLWPVLLALAVAIKQSSSGPVLFKQRRYGLNGEEILVYKFRSMTVCEDGPVIAQATKQDARFTRVGAFLRRTSLDELPQILNVLEGKMSVVGPRPHAVAHNEEYRKLINGYMIRHKVRPGITGWAQVNGLRGETSTVEKMRERIQYDIDYLKNWSLWLDLKILVKTALIVFRDANAY